MFEPYPWPWTIVLGLRVGFQISLLGFVLHLDAVWKSGLAGLASAGVAIVSIDWARRRFSSD